MNIQLITLLAILAVTLISYAVTYYAHRDDASYNKIFINYYVLVFLAALAGVLLSFQINQYGETYRERENFNEKLQSVRVEVEDNLGLLAIMREGLVTKSDSETYVSLPFRRVGTKSAESLALDSNVTKFLDAQGMQLLQGYLTKMQITNDVIDFYRENIFVRNVHELSDVEKIDVRLGYSIETAENFRMLVEYLRDKYGAEKPIDPTVDGLVQKQHEIEKKYAR